MLREIDGGDNAAAAVDPILDAEPAQRIPICDHVHGQHRLVQPTLSLGGHCAIRKVGADLQNGVESSRSAETDMADSRKPEPLRHQSLDPI